MYAAGPDEPGVVLRVAIWRVGRAVQGRIELVDVGGRTTWREVTGGECAEVVQALALVGVMLLEAARPDEPEPTAPPAAQQATRRPNQPDRSWSVGGGTEVAFGPLPRPAPASLLAASVSGARWQLKTDWVFALPQRFHTTEGAGTVLWTTTRWAPCPAPFPRRGRLSLSPCLMLELGLVHAHADQGAIAAWVTPGVEVAADLMLSRRWFSALHGVVGVPLARSQVRFDPEPVVYQVGTISAGVGLTVGAVTRGRKKP